MALDPVQISLAIKHDLKRYLTTALGISPKYQDLKDQFLKAIADDNILFRGPYLQGTPPYRKGTSLTGLVKEKVLPSEILKIPFLGEPERELYWHQVETIRKVRLGHNVVLASGTGSGKTLSFLVPIITEILQNPEPGVHALLLYPMNALVNDQLKTLRQILKDQPDVRFGRYVNVNITPEKEHDARLLHPGALKNEVVSREEFRRQPPHILITNYAMLEYLLLREKDSPLFSGPWKYVVLDELHTYSGAKGSEVALLFRRLCSRVKKDLTTKGMQFIATSASLGTSDDATRQEVASFASQLFDSQFSISDLVEAKLVKLKDIGKSDLEVSSAVYTEDVLQKSCDIKQWSEGLTETLINNDFPPKLIQQAEMTAEKDFEAALYQVFARDKRVEKLRQAVENIPDLTAAARQVFGSREPDAVESLIGFVRICSLAKMPTSDARLVPCRYHFFVRGVNGGYLAFDQIAGFDTIQPTLMLEPTKIGPDGKTKTLGLKICRKCGQPYAYGYKVMREGKLFLDGFRTNLEEKSKPVWFVWNEPKIDSIDEEDEQDEDTKSIYAEYQYCSKCGRLGQAAFKCDCEKEPQILKLWEVPLNKNEEANKCIACRGSSSISDFRADSEAAQAVVAESFYKQLPASNNRKALRYPGKGRKLLVFSDSRQSAAYFAPYVENTHTEQKLRWLIFQALKEALSGGTSSISADTLVSYMLRINSDTPVFPYDWDDDKLRAECGVAITREFCLPTSRRQSLEALGMVKVAVDLGKFYSPPEELIDTWKLRENEVKELIQVLLTTIRLQKLVELPPPLTHNDQRFKPWDKNSAIIDRQSENDGGYALYGFVPEKSPIRQRRGAFVSKVLNTAAKRAGLKIPDDKDIRNALFHIWESLIENDEPGSPFKRVTVAEGKVGFQIRWKNLRFSLPEDWFYCSECNQWSAFDVAKICPSFGCSGNLQDKDPAEHFRFHHYRQLYTSPSIVPFVAKEHTAQLSPELAAQYQEAFQEGYSSDGQINILSCSTTFELGVDLGDLEAVYLRDVPPTPANYQQRSGRAGRGAGTAAFVVTFALSRSHDANFFAAPEEIIAGKTHPPRITLENEIIIRRHVNSVLIAQYFRDLGLDPRGIGEFFQDDEKGSLY